MKKVFNAKTKEYAITALIAFSIIAYLCSCNVASAQTIKLINGKYTTIKNDSTSKTSGVLTGQVFVDKDGKEYPVYRGIKGGLYAIVTNKRGVQYKKYMPKS